MFDFMDEDWFIITSEIIFLIFIIFDFKKYIQTKKKEYILNIIITIGFAIWTLYPMYICYFKWDETQKESMLKKCQNDTTCKCINKSITKSYSFNEYKNFTKVELEKITKEKKEECLDDGWF